MLSFTLGIHHKNPEKNMSISRVIIDSAVIYILFTIAYYTLITSISSLNFIPIACSLIHLKCNIDIILNCFDSYHSIISHYMYPTMGENINISTDDFIISTLALFLAGLEFISNITMLGSIYFDTMRHAYRQLSSPGIHTFSKFIGIICFCSRSCDYIDFTDYKVYTSFVSENFSHPLNILKQFNPFTRNNDTEEAKPSFFKQAM